MSEKSTEVPSETAPMAGGDTQSHDIPFAEHLKQALSQNWDPAPAVPHPAHPDVAAQTVARRFALTSALPGRLIVVPSGNPKVRSNDTDYPFRPASSFTWLTGETVEDAVLVIPPDGEATLYVREWAEAGRIEYFASRLHGTVWVGNMPNLADTSTALGLRTRPLAALADDLARYQDTPTALLPDVDASVAELLPQADDGAALFQLLDELRLIKDDWEIDRLRAACESTARGFEDVVRELPKVVGRSDIRGERWLEGTFWRRARLEGNEVGYSSIVGSGRHATTLHWVRNDGAIEAGGLMLCDMGIETDELYTADVTRTLPVDGEWSPAQLRVYRAVQEAQAAGIGEVKAGADFLSAHRAAMWVLADHLHSWGVLEVPAEVSCDDDEDRPGAGLHRRYTLHGTSHMLGIDVHDCAQAREQAYREGTLEAGHVLTVEPGLYFQVNDRSVPAELRGIGVRIEDDIAVTDGAPENLSASLPRDPDGVIEWLREAQASPATP